MAMGLKELINKNNRQEMTDSDMLPSDSGGLVEMKRKRRETERESSGVKGTVRSQQPCT